MSWGCHGQHATATLSGLADWGVGFPHSRRWVCSNYRGIKLLSAPCKFCAGVLVCSLVNRWTCRFHHCSGTPLLESWREDGNLSNQSPCVLWTWMYLFSWVPMKCHQLQNTVQTHYIEDVSSGYMVKYPRKHFVWANRGNGKGERSERESQSCDVVSLSVGLRCFDVSIFPLTSNLWDYLKSLVIFFLPPPIFIYNQTEIHYKTHT